MPAQVYVVPTPDGWAVNVWGDEVLPDDGLVPLPLTRQVSFDEAVTFVEGTALGLGAFMVDGWEDAGELLRSEPLLYERAGWFGGGAAPSARRL